MPATMRVEVNPALLRWARDRAGLTVDDLLHRFPKLSEWEAGTAKPTLRQLEAFASAVAVPFGYLFLPEPPQETLPVPDFRTLDDRQVTRPSPDLLETIFDMQRRQAWLRDDRIEAGYDPLSFVGSVTAQALPAVVAAAMRRTIGIADSWAELHGTWTDALNWLRSRAEMIGIIIVINGVVGNNTSRKLDPEEFRGFVLPDDYAPFVFINGADGRAAQIIRQVFSICAPCSLRPTRARGSATPWQPNFSSPNRSCRAHGALLREPRSPSRRWPAASRSANWSWRAAHLMHG